MLRYIVKCKVFIKRVLYLANLAGLSNTIKSFNKLAICKEKFNEFKILKIEYFKRHNAANFT